MGILIGGIVVGFLVGTSSATKIVYYKNLLKENKKNSNK